MILSIKKVSKMFYIIHKKNRNPFKDFGWGNRGGSNPRPSESQSDALTN